MKSLYDISWQVTEEEYRQDPALSYSTLAKFNREGFNNLDKLFDRVDTPSLTFGSAVDSLITGGHKEFDERFITLQFPQISDAIVNIVKDLFQKYSDNYTSIEAISDADIINVASEFNYQNNWRPETRAKVIREKGSEYYNLLYLAQGKTILSTEIYQDVMNAVNALTEGATQWYFAPNGDDGIERLYQLKFKATFRNVDYRCMADLIIVDYNSKTVQPVDLKTSSHTEWDFYKSFVDWSYHIQARLYWRIIRDNMDRDEFFKDFKLLDYQFIVVNRRTLTPLVWDFESTQSTGTLKFGKKEQLEFKDPCDIGDDLYYYLSSRPLTPIGIETHSSNSLKDWLNTI